MAKRYTTRRVNADAFNRICEGMKPMALAIRAGVGIQTIYKMKEGGICEIEKIGKVAAVLGVKPDALILDAGSSQSQSSAPKPTQNRIYIQILGTLLEGSSYLSASKEIDDFMEKLRKCGIMARVNTTITHGKMFSAEVERRHDNRIENASCQVFVDEYPYIYEHTDESYIKNFYNFIVMFDNEQFLNYGESIANTCRPLWTYAITLGSIDI